MLVVPLCAAPLFAIDLNPIETSGQDQDIIFEAGLAPGAVGATGELGSRQFFEAGVFADGVPRTLPAFTSAVTGNTINFAFQPFEQNNIIKLDSVNVGPKTLTLAVPGKYGQLAVVFSGGSLAIATEFAVQPYTINYVGGATQSGELQVPDWGGPPPTPITPNTEDLFNADRTNADLRMAPATTDNNTTAGRWSISVQEITPNQPGVNIQSITFGQPMLSQNGTIVPLIAGDDVVIYGLSGSGDALLLGDTDADGVVEFEDDFNPIRNNFRKTVTTRAEGDLVRNGTVDFNDFHQWKTAFVGAGGSLAGLDLSLIAEVPEPTSLGLVVFAACGLAAHTRLRHLA